jgi:hypothetical protein
VSPKGKAKSSMFNQPILSLDMNLAKQLKKMLEQSGASVTHLSKATKVPGQTIHNWIAGSKPRDLDQVKKVADHFKVSLDFLVYGEDEKIKSASPFKEHQDEINAGIFEVVLRRVKK